MENGLSIFDREPLLIGILVNSLKKAFRVVDVGPNAKHKDEALKFRNFGGEKAELRRFKDGMFAESTVWESKQWERPTIIKKDYRISPFAAPFLVRKKYRAYCRST